jgi:hypothetical protein
VRSFRKSNQRCDEWKLTRSCVCISLICWLSCQFVRRLALPSPPPLQPLSLSLSLRLRVKQELINTRRGWCVTHGRRREALGQNGAKYPNNVCENISRSSYSVIQSTTYMRFTFMGLLRPIEGEVLRITRRTSLERIIRDGLAFMKTHATTVCFRRRFELH